MTKTTINDTPIARLGTLGLTALVLRRCARRDAGRIAVGLLLLIGASAATLLQPWPLKIVVDSVLGRHAPPASMTHFAQLIGQYTPATGHPKVELLLVLTLSILAIQLIMGTFNVASTYVLVSVGLHMVFKLRCELFEHLQRLSLRFHDDTPVGDSLYRVTWDTYGVQTLFNGGIVPAITAFLTLLGIAIVMFSLNWITTLAALGIGIPIIGLIRRLDGPMTERSLRVHERESDVSSQVQETLVGIRAIQSFGREDYEVARFRDYARASLRANLRLTVLQAGSQAAVALLLAAGTAAVVFVAALEALSGRITVGDIVLLVSYLALLYTPLETLAYTAATVQGAVAGARRVLTVLAAMPDITDRHGAIALDHGVAGHIAFESLSFGYGRDRLALRDISLDVPAGLTVALVGPSGAGKTTIASMLMRFYDPTGGRITLDGLDLRAISVASLRHNVALVLQEPILFGASIRENIAYGRPDATLDEVVRSATSAGADNFIRALPEGYDTQIGERGIALSGGQRQRLSIARAFLKDAPILILDEPTSALDAETEEYLVNTLRQLMAGRTTFIIAHRLSTIRHADQIVVLKDGRIVQQGTYDELLTQAGVFRKLHTIQYGAADVRPLRAQTQWL